MVAYLYNEYDKAKNIYQPQISRSRQIYRGPRETKKQNLEQDQFLHDVAKLRKRILEAEQLLSTMSASMYFHTPSVPNTEPKEPFFPAGYYNILLEQEKELLLTDTVDLSSQVFRLLAKIKRFENQEI